MSFLSRFVDERFLSHRRRSTSIAGMVCAATALGLWAYHFYVRGEFRPELFGLGLLFVVVKLAVMFWSYWTE
jgi:hypothetical protein